MIAANFPSIEAGIKGFFTLIWANPNLGYRMGDLAEDHPQTRIQAAYWETRSGTCRGATLSGAGCKEAVCATDLDLQSGTGGAQA